MLEVYPEFINQEKLEANLSKLVSAFLMIAEDLVQEENRHKKSLRSETHEIKEDSASCNDSLQMSLLSAVRCESKREEIKTLKT